ncbi:MAG: tRNA (adenosine(37)-N6)-threonylcarbamoyltransferase complex dimerization subunit type 1 TsaB [Christensenellaceae bacterium]
MKNFLAIDTSSKYMTVLAAKEGQTFFSHTPDCAMRHSVRLMGAIDGVLKEAKLSLDECDFFSAVVGAGSFTGIRIGIATAKGFCLAEGKPSLPVTSFDVAAYNALDGERALALVDALHGNYYACGFDERKNKILPACLSLGEEVLRLIGRATFLFHGGVAPVREAAVRKADPVEGLKRALAALSKDAENFGELSALYIRKSQAEENRKDV